MRRTGRLIITTAIGMVLLVGCSGSPDVDGEWEITVPVSEVNMGDTEPRSGNIVYEADIEQLDGGGLAGDATAEAGGYTCEYEILSPDNVAGTDASASRISEDGDITLNMDANCGSDADWINFGLVFQGTVEGDEMVLEAENAMEAEEAAESLPTDSIVFGGYGGYAALPGTFTGERGSGGSESDLGASDSGNNTEVAQSDDEGETSVLETTVGPSTRELAKEFYAQEDDLSLMHEELERRIAYLEEPEEDLEEGLGPETQNPDTFDCASDPVSCEVAILEDRVGQDRRDFEEAGYGPAGCEETSDTDYYAAVRDFDSAGGETFITERNQVSENADGLEEYAQDTLDQARETEAAYDEARDAKAVAQEMSHTVEDIEPLIDEAREAEQRADSAITQAEQRYGVLENRAKEALSRAEALYARAGCAI